MVFYTLFLGGFALVLYRIFRSQKFGSRLVLFALALFLALTFAVHPWIENSSGALGFLEKLALLVSLLWLGLDPFLEWTERRSERKKAFHLLRNGRGPLWEIVAASRSLSEEKQGGLIAIERKDPLADWIHTGVPVDAEIRRETIYSIFTSLGALHDGGMVIRGDRIAACGVVFPLSQRLDLPTELGTRHRAALGLSEATDALVLVISEETGKISLADQGSLLYNIQPEKLPEFLEKALEKRLVRVKAKRKPFEGKSFGPELRPSRQLARV